MNQKMAKEKKIAASKPSTPQGASQKFPTSERSSKRARTTTPVSIFQATPTDEVDDIFDALPHVNPRTPAEGNNPACAAIIDVIAFKSPKPKPYLHDSTVMVVVSRDTYPLKDYLKGVAAFPGTEKEGSKCRPEKPLLNGSFLRSTDLLERMQKEEGSDFELPKDLVIRNRPPTFPNSIPCFWVYTVAGVAKDDMLEVSNRMCRLARYLESKEGSHLPDNRVILVHSYVRVLEVSSLRLLRHYASKYPILPAVDIKEEEDDADNEEDSDYEL
jgi:hypothetical protein